MGKLPQYIERSATRIRNTVCNCYMIWLQITISRTRIAREPGCKSQCEDEKKSLMTFKKGLTDLGANHNVRDEKSLMIFKKGLTDLGTDHNVRDTEGLRKRRNLKNIVIFCTIATIGCPSLSLTSRFGVHILRPFFKRVRPFL